jgi:predicted membrane channel-forming protein YqfA (hemolysin III family)
MRYKTRRRLSLLVLVLGVPAYIVVAVSLIALFDRPPFWVELLVYIGLGVLWIIPLKPLFLGVGQPDPDDKT